MSDREAQDGVDAESTARAMLCDEVDSLREECGFDGTLDQLDRILQDAARGLPVIDLMSAIGLTVDRGRGYMQIPGTRRGPSPAVWYECPLTVPCPRQQVAGPGEFPKCHLSGDVMTDLGSGTSP